MKVDSIIVGFGLAGLAIAEQLRRRGKTFVLVDNLNKGASQRAAGVYNPTVLKRYTLSWDGPELLQQALNFYRDLEASLEEKFLHPLPIARIFHSPAEHNRWISAADKYEFKKFLNPTIQRQVPQAVYAPFGYGLVENVGRLDIPSLLQKYRKVHLQKSLWYRENCNYQEIICRKEAVQYKDVTAKHMIFCEGYQVHLNPFFKYLPIRGSHGDMLRIKAPQMDVTRIWKSRLFVVPQGESRFWIGASYNNRYKEAEPTTQGRAWLIDHLEHLIQVPYTIESQEGCVRPTVMDRRPLVGTHPIEPRLHILNGLGSRGVMTAPQMGVHLCHLLYEQKPLPKAIGIERFRHLC
ncbi:MAG: NAD(P)/FAD-dependent oxidoreductase [Flavobacteriaceae bacterium]